MKEFIVKANSIQNRKMKNKVKCIIRNRYGTQRNQKKMDKIFRKIKIKLIKKKNKKK